MAEHGLPISCDSRPRLIPFGPGRTERVLIRLPRRDDTSKLVAELPFGGGALGHFHLPGGEPLGTLGRRGNVLVPRQILERRLVESAHKFRGGGKIGLPLMVQTGPIRLVRRTLLQLPRLRRRFLASANPFGAFLHLFSQPRHVHRAGPQQNRLYLSGPARLQSRRGSSRLGRAARNHDLGNVFEGDSNFPMSGCFKQRAIKVVSHPGSVVTGDRDAQLAPGANRNFQTDAQACSGDFHFTVQPFQCL